MKQAGGWIRVTCAAVALTMTVAASASAQVAKSFGVVDVNTIAEKDLAALPNMTPAIAKALVAKRPFNSITELNAFLLAQGLTAEQAMAFYPKAFVHINLNTATAEEILLVPGAGRKMTIEFPEYRPWKTWAQFDRQIGKYIGGAENAQKLAQYTFIPMNANTARRRGPDDGAGREPGVGRQAEEGPALQDRRGSREGAPARPRRASSSSNRRP